MGNYTSFLFAPPSFTEGMGRILDFGDTLTEYNTSPSPDEADANAILADWCAVGCDLSEVMRRHIHGKKSKGTAGRAS